MTNMKVVDLTTKVFKLEKPMANVSVDLYAPVDNSWLYMDGDLVDNKTGETYPLAASAEYYHGVTDGESWSEGGTNASMVISKVPAGEYYVNMDLQSGDFSTSKEQRGCTLTITRDVPQWANYWWRLLLISLAPLWTLWLCYRDESTRWAESDFSPYAALDSD